MGKLLEFSDEDNYIVLKSGNFFDVTIKKFKISHMVSMHTSKFREDLNWFEVRFEPDRKGTRLNIIRGDGPVGDQHPWDSTKRRFLEPELNEIEAIRWKHPARYDFEFIIEDRVEISSKPIVIKTKSKELPTITASRSLDLAPLAGASVPHKAFEKLSKALSDTDGLLEDFAAWKFEVTAPDGKSYSIEIKEKNAEEKESTSNYG